MKVQLVGGLLDGEEYQVEDQAEFIRPWVAGQVLLERACLSHKEYYACLKESAPAPPARQFLYAISQVNGRVVGTLLREEIPGTSDAKESA